MPRPLRRGTRSCWQKGCGHPECHEAAKAEWAAYYEIRKQYTHRPHFVSPARAIQHIQHLRARGMGRAQIARAAGMTKSNVGHLEERHDKKILDTTERRILAVKFAPARVRPLGTMRRLQALAALGHPWADVSSECGVSVPTIVRIANGHQKWVSVDTVQTVADAFDRLSMRTGRSSVTRGRAAARGWAPPLAWDEGALDDPQAAPAGHAARQKRASLDLDEWQTLVQAGEDPARAADRCGVTLSAVERMAWRRERPDLASIAGSARKRWSVA